MASFYTAVGQCEVSEWGFRGAGALRGSSVLLQPGLHGVATVLLFPGLQGLVVATLGLDGFTIVRVLVNLQLASAARLLRAGRFGGSLRVENVDDIAQVHAVLVHQGLQLILELQFFLQAAIALEFFEQCELLLEFALGFAEFRKFGHLVAPVCRVD